MTTLATTEFMPAPRADQLAPSHFAMRLALTPPAVVKAPPAYRFPPPSEARSLTQKFMPVPSADQLVPSHRATRFAATFPVVVKSPPA